MLRSVSEAMCHQLEEYGAVSSQLVDLTKAESPRTLKYLDLVRAPAADRPPLVIESQGQPRVYVFDGSDAYAQSNLNQWVRRIAFRGDAEWVGVLRPGRLDIFRAALDGGNAKAVAGLPQGAGLVPTLAYMPAGAHSAGVRARLLTLLRRSIENAKALGVEPDDALSLVGRALFWRFLIDRGLLEGLRHDDVCDGARTWPACLSTKRNALQTFEWLDETFNGGLLPMSRPTAFAAEVFTSVVGNIAHGANAEGQLALDLPNDWREVNFAHVAVGLLSEVYEAFAHAESSKKARAESVFYTPRHIAEPVVDDALDAAASVPEPRVLDPAAGAGVFLVAMFRALVAREWARSGKRPSRSVVRRILNTQLTGFDINPSALRLAELALYLTAIELDPEPRPRPLKLLRFDPLRDQALFLKDGGVEKGSLAPAEPRFRAKFDIVIGNPPWTAAASVSAKRHWVAASLAVVTERLGTERAAVFDFADTNPDLPFVYRAMEWAKPGACIALITHARWLFGQTEAATRARNDLLQSVHVTGLLNGTALRDTSVWPNVRHPFCVLFAANEKPPPGSAFLFVSPELDRVPDRVQSRIRIDWQDAREVVADEVVANPWTLKARFRGGPFDETVVSALKCRGMPLGEYLKSLGTRLRNGYQVGGAAGTQQSAEHLRGLPDLRGVEPRFLVDTGELERMERTTLLFPRPREIYRAPLLLIHESMRADEQSARASLSMNDVAYDERFDGASFATVPSGAAIGAYLQIMMQSSLFRHALLMLDGQFGVEREVVHLRTIESVPVVRWNELPAPQREQCARLSRRLHSGLSPTLMSAIDEFAFDALRLSNVQRDAVLDTLATASPTAATKQNALRMTTEADRKAFAEVCAGSLRSVFAASGRDARVRLREDMAFAAWRVLQVDRFTGNEPGLATVDHRRFIEGADEASASLVVVRASAETTLVAILDRYRYWTRTRARVLAASLLLEHEGDA